MKRVTNKMIAVKALERLAYLKQTIPGCADWSADKLNDGDLEQAYEALREEVGNPAPLFATKSRSFSQSRLSDDRIDAIYELMRKLTKES